MGVEKSKSIKPPKLQNYEIKTRNKNECAKNW
jgi:hypothetical protein